MKNAALIALAHALRNHIKASPKVDGVLVSPGLFTFTGERKVDAFASVALVDPRLSDEPSLNGLGDDLMRYLTGETDFCPGPQAAVIFAYRDRATVHVRLARSWIDTSEAHRTHDVLVNVGGERHRARIGSLVASIQEVREDGSLVFVQTMETSGVPGRNASVYLPNQNMPLNVVCMNIPSWLRIAQPTEEDLLAWSDTHYGPLQLNENVLVPYSKVA